MMTIAFFEHTYPMHRHSLFTFEFESYSPCSRLRRLAPMSAIWKANQQVEFPQWALCGYPAEKSERPVCVFTQFSQKMAGIPK
jgi:hypothetical protein